MCRIARDWPLISKATEVGAMQPLPQFKLLFVGVTEDTRNFGNKGVSGFHFRGIGKLIFPVYCADVLTLAPRTASGAGQEIVRRER